MTVARVLLVVLALAGCGSPAARVGESYTPATGANSPANREAASPASEATYQVARVIDGDTVELEGGDRVRLLCIDTPERGKPGYTEATEFLRDLVEGTRVRLEADPQHADRDRFGRLLRYVWVGELLVNVDLVRQGHSEYVTKWGASCLHAIEFESAR